MAPIGGGGMISGTCLTLSNAWRQKRRSSPPNQNRLTTPMRSFKAGYIIADDAPKTIADGLAGAAEGPYLAFRVKPRD